MRVEWCEFLVHPTQVQQTIDLPYQMIRRYAPVEIKRIKELALTALLPPQHASLPANARLNRTESRSAIRLNWSLATQSPNSGHRKTAAARPKSANTDREFTFAATIPTNLGHHKEVAPYLRITSMAERWGPGSTSCAEQRSQNSAACRSQVE
jgi:hypothetical protein